MARLKRVRAALSKASEAWQAGQQIAMARLKRLVRILVGVTCHQFQDAELQAAHAAGQVPDVEVLGFELAGCLGGLV